MTKKSLAKFTFVQQFLDGTDIIKCESCCDENSKKFLDS